MIEIKNKSAYFNYFVEKEIECGIVLNGSEIKSIRNGSCNIKDSYVRIKDNECYIINMFIAKYNEASIFNHDEYHERKLLLHKREIYKLKEEINQNGYTLIPLKVYGVDVLLYKVTTIVAFELLSETFISNKFLSTLLVW